MAIALLHSTGEPEIDRILSGVVTYPDPDDEFYGYTRDGMRGLHGWAGPGTKALVGGATMAATTLVALATGHCAVRSGESVAAYRARVGDEWAGFLDELYARCKREWGYREPTAIRDRRRLRALCRRMLAFENYYLEACEGPLLTSRQSSDPRVARLADQALVRLGQSAAGG
jgi:hypothetical protein